MPDNFESDGTRPNQPQFNLEDFDFDKIYRLVRFGLGLLALILLWMAVSWGHDFYTDWLWYKGLGYKSVLLTIISAKVVLFLIAAGLFTVLALPNLYLARRHTAGLRPVNPNVPLNLYQTATKLLGWGTAGVLLLAAIYLGITPASEWETMLRYLHQVPFGESDPVFGKDFSFYIFTVPVLEFIKTWLLSAIVAIIVVVGARYYLSSTFRGEVFSLSGRALTHLAGLAAAALVLIAFGHWLSRYELLYSSLGTVYGVGYTDSRILLPGYTILTFVALVAAAFMLAGALSRNRKLIVWPLAVWLGLNVLVTFVAPGLFQRLAVEPSELAREKEYLRDNIQHTRNAFGLEGLVSRSHPARGELDREVIEANQGTIQNVRLWDEGPLLQSYNQIQFFRLYYDFLKVHTDRYEIDGELRQIMLATRELSADKLPEEAQRWVNRHLQFTHGYGLAASPVTEVESGGRPSFFLSDIPPQGKIELNRPEIYYGLKSLDHVIVNSQMQEFNFPGPDGPVYTHYKGEGGVKLDSFLRRLMYAWKFKDINILISGEITDESRIQYRRTVSERFSTLTPFLTPDQEAYSVVADGRLFWIQDAYTTADRYPYSTPWQDSFNYIRNSVKAVVDAYNGSTDFYVADPEDPLIQTYRQIFPDLFKSMQDMPEYLKAHVRYPQDLFTVQTQMLLQYHMKDPVVFYNKEDQWSVPVQSSFGGSEVLKPYYLVARLPGEEQEEFLLIQPFTPQNRHNLVGWLAARMDGEHYGELTLFEFPSGRHVDGPNQVEARIDNDAVISEQFTLWGQVGSEVSRGILLVVPVGDSILYAEPVFLTPETIEFPELRRIILADAKQVVMHKTLDDSIDALVGELPPVAPPVETEEPEEPGEPGEAAPPGWREGVDEAIENLQKALDQLKKLI
ncbi:MAG: UPF0182 family protein [Desulfohalobiaceae bacterium]|nr:UPF0182 family protein [Desulfohalobiaceae bacterium]